MRSIRLRAVALILTALGLIGIPAAMAGIDGTASIQLQINDRRSVGLNSGVNIPINPTPSITFTDGVGANAANQIYQANRALTAGADSVDLAGALTDGYGSTVALVRVKAIYIKNTGTTDLTFGAGSNPFITMLNSTGTITLKPGAFVLLATPDATGYAVTAGTGDLINVTGTGTSTYSIAVLGGKS